MGETALVRIEKGFDESKETILKFLPDKSTYDSFRRSAIIAIHNNTKLQECGKDSILEAVYSAAELGLDFIAAKGHAYLIPFKKKAVFMPGYRGLMDLTRRSGLVTKITSHVVKERDSFSVEYGIRDNITHTPEWKNAGAVVGAYAIAWLKDAEPVFEFMTLEELEGIRSKSRSKDDGPWKSHTNEMYRKTVIKRLIKYLPVSSENLLMKAVEHDNNAGDFTPITIDDDTPTVKTAKTKTKVKNKDVALPAEDEIIIPEDQGEENTPLPEILPKQDEDESIF